MLKKLQILHSRITSKKQVLRKAREPVLFQSRCEVDTQGTHKSESEWSTRITLHKLRLPNCFETSPSHPPAYSEITNSIFICWIKLPPHYPHPHPTHINCLLMSRIQQRSETALDRKCLGVSHSGTADPSSAWRQPRFRVTLLYKFNFKSPSA